MNLSTTFDTVSTYLPAICHPCYTMFIVRSRTHAPSGCLSSFTSLRHPWTPPSSTCAMAFSHEPLCPLSSSSSSSSSSWILTSPRRQAIRRTSTLQTLQHRLIRPFRSTSSAHSDLHSGSQKQQQPLVDLALLDRRIRIFPRPMPRTYSVTLMVVLDSLQECIPPFNPNLL